MKKNLIIITLLLLSSLLMAKEMQESPNPYREVLVPKTGNWSYQTTRPVPVWSFSVSPQTLLTSYYDYMIGSYNSTPVYVQPDPTYGGYFLNFHAKRTTTGQRRVFYAYIDNNGFLENNVELTNIQNWEGYPSLAVDPVSGKPFYAWHVNADTDAEYEVQYAYDAFLFGCAGLLSDPVIVIDNPSTVSPQNTTNNEFIWPTVQIGPSPLANKRRVYVLARNAETHITNPCENVKIAYADFDGDMLEMGIPLVWCYVSIPTLDAWNHDTAAYRRPFFAFTVSNDGKIYYMGYHTATTGNPEQPIDEPDLDVFVCDNYGQGIWQRYTAYSKVPSWNPPTLWGTGPGYFANTNSVPYTNDQIFWKITNSSHMNAMYNTNGSVHSAGLWSLFNSDNSYYPNFNVMKELVFNTLTNTFSIREIYPISGTSSDNTIWQPWDMNGDNLVDNYTDTTGDPITTTDWNYPYWNSSVHTNAMTFHYNNFKITKPNAQGWMAAVWQNSWRAKQYNEQQNNAYAQYATVPEIFIAVSSDYGQNWSEPIVINSVQVTQFAGIRPMWVYPADIVQNIGLVNGQPTGKLALMFYHDNTWGAYSIESPVGQNDGGAVKFMTINIQMNTIAPTGFTGFVRNSATQQPIANAVVTNGIVSTQTTSTGSYTINLTPGTHTLTVSKIGYNAQTLANLLVSEGQVTNLDFALVPIPTVNVFGAIQGGIPITPMADVTVTLTGVLQYSAITSASGIFVIPNVLTNQVYQYSISKPGFQAQTGYITVLAEDNDMGLITLNELALPPLSITAQTQAGNNTVQLQWSAPNLRGNTYSSRVIHKDNPITDDLDRMITGYNIWRLLTGQEAQESLWTHISDVNASMTTTVDTLWKYLPAGLYRYAVKAEYSGANLSIPTFSSQLQRYVSGSVYGTIYDLDSNPLSNAVVSLSRIEPNGEGPYSGVTNNSGQFAISNIWYGNYSVVCSGVGYCTPEQTNVYITENQNLLFNYYLQDVIIAPINAVAELILNNTQAVVTWEFPEADSTRRFYGYKVWRLLSENEQNPELWTQLGNVLLVTNYVDIAWTDLPSGMYKYAVKAIYAGNYSSLPVFSNELEKTTSVSPDYNELSHDKFIGVYPNPMVNTATISFALCKASPVTFEIYNVNGQLITKQKHNSAKGINQIELKAIDNNGQRLTSGVYICRMITGKVIASQKVVVLK